MRLSDNTTSPKPRKKAKVFALSVLALALGMVVLAVAAKTLHYSARTAQTRYFSSSVKMANYGHRQTPSVRQVAVPAPIIRLEEPEQTFSDYKAPSFPAATPDDLGPTQLRAPPAIS